VAELEPENPDLKFEIPESWIWRFDYGILDLEPLDRDSSLKVSHRSRNWDSLVGHFIVVFNKVNPSCPAVPLVPRKNKTFACGKVLTDTNVGFMSPGVCPKL
jgi:hypothetical protein